MKNTRNQRDKLQQFYSALLDGIYQWWKQDLYLFIDHFIKIILIKYILCDNLKLISFLSFNYMINYDSK